MLKREAPTIRPKYTYRRRLEPVELLPALGIGIGVGAIAFYLAYVMLQRTSLDPNTLPAASPAKRLGRGASD